MLDELLEIILLDAEEHMEKSLAHLRKELSAIRAGRATPAMLQTVRVEYYGSRSPLNQVATISAPQPDLLVVAPWDKSAMGAIEKAIQSANLGLNPSNDGLLIRVPVPPLSGDRRQSLCRRARRLAEEAKVAVRNIRRHAKDQVKSTQEDENLSEDMRYHAEEELQKRTDRYVEQIDATSRRKEAEILEI
ncbi:MAG: ribosome recycling factor [Bacteroidota bacterium]|nr:ribosome recycling factor [Bacteroidota bacterium]MDE2835095.1 ribosome recycling factor [Bacteroidota bacterium]MDE2956344.1 ribosome recycling factor [Bacteroidota bacterium]